MSTIQSTTRLTMLHFQICTFACQLPPEYAQRITESVAAKVAAQIFNCFKHFLQLGFCTKVSYYITVNLHLYINLTWLIKCYPEWNILVSYKRYT